MSRKRRTHSAVFKAKVAVAAIRGEKTLAELSEQFQIHSNQIQNWKKQLLNGAEDLFENGSGQKKRKRSGLVSLDSYWRFISDLCLARQPLNLNGMMWSF